MKANEIKVGGLYKARVNGRYTTVRVDRINTEREPVHGTNRTRLTGRGSYDVTNLSTGRKTTFRSAAKFRREVKPFTADQKAMMAADAGIPFTHQQVEEMRKEDMQAQEASEEADPTLAIQSERMDTVSALDVENIERSALSQAENGFVNSADKEGEKGADPTAASGVGDTEGGDQAGVPATAAATSAPTTLPQAGTTTATSFASRIGRVGQVRTPGTPVAGMTPNEEQESIIAAAVESGLKVLVVGAGAGTGKTATLKMLEQVIPGSGQYTAFNASLVAEGKAKFRKAACNTTHSLAFRAVGRLYAHRLNGDRVRSYEVARILGIADMTITIEGMGAPEYDAEGKPTGKNLDKVKVLKADFLAGQVIVAVRRFCQSADAEIGAQHLRYIDGIDAVVGERRGRENNDRVRDYLLPFCIRAWTDLGSVNGSLPFNHDCYVKIWQLGKGSDRPVIAADYILLDEAQDTAPVFLDILKQQAHALLVFVGDSNQAIYEWRGAVDAMKAYPNATRRLLSQSYRFGQAVADVANAVLATLDDPTDLVMRGNPAIPSRIAEVAEPRCYLYRTNAGAVGRVMAAIGVDKRPHLIGGGDEVVKWMQAAIDLQAKRGTRHPELCCFDTWAEVQEYSKTDEGSDMRLMVKLADEFTPEAIRDALKDMPDEEEADLVVSTAHKSKGREWDTVKLGQDFPNAQKMGDADRRLLYVAATRVKLVLDITECPPFCGEHKRASEGFNGEGGWVPGLVITYTQPMPSEEDLAAYRAAKSNPASPTITNLPASAVPTTQPAVAPPAANSAPANGGSNGRPACTYTKLRDGDWGIRATVAIKEGDEVVVEQRNGTKRTERVGRVLWNDGKVWLAKKG